MEKYCIRDIKFHLRSKLHAVTWASNGAAGALWRTFCLARSVCASTFFDSSVVNNVDKKNGMQTSLYKTIMHDPLLHGFDWAALAQLYFRSLLKSIHTLGESKVLWHSLQMNAIKLMALKVPPRIISCVFSDPCKCLVH